MDETLTIQETMTVLHRSEKVVRGYIKSGKLSAEIGQDGRYHILKSDVDHLAKRPGHIQVDKVTRQVSKIEDRLTEIEKRLEDLARRLEDLASHPTPTVPPLPDPTTHPRARPITSSSSGRVKSARPELPADYVTWRSFADRHGVVQTTVQGAIERGLLPVQKGQWKLGRATVNSALDAQGRRAFYEIYHSWPNFQTCPECPHDAK